ncbi:hypothetical protein NQ318_011073 [Aromia moschata]|uniref:Uncharacterized protein n=1 Tax=Aromia moschata TaxID=1265417 RepID=A0AAV8YUH3_9CUCU|nr:hypothetical protein NQ318_011073 [Aromia moschata]
MYYAGSADRISNKQRRFLKELQGIRRPMKLPMLGMYFPWLVKFAKKWGGTKSSRWHCEAYSSLVRSLRFCKH